MRSLLFVCLVLGLGLACNRGPAPAPPAELLQDVQQLPVDVTAASGLAAAVSPADAPSLTTTLAIANDGTATTVFVSFGADSVVLPATWQFCLATAPLNCSFALPAHATQTVAVNAYLNATLSFGGQGCGTSKAELNLHNPEWFDTADVSLVDGWNRDLSITLDGVQLGPTLGASGNASVFGVFPLGCDVCVARQSPPCGFAPSPTPGSAGCKSGTQYQPAVPCQAQGKHKGGGGSILVKVLAP